MKWRGRRGSANIEDRRRSGGRAGGGMRRAGGVGGLGAVAIIVIGMLLGVDTSFLLGGGAGGLDGDASYPSPSSQVDDDAGAFVSVVLADTEEVWTEIFAKQLNRRYEPPTLVLFAGRTTSSCRAASAATGPFYCPPDNRAYLDTTFFRTLDQQLGAGGDFARAYVIAHEVAHHVQNQLGILPEVNRLRSQSTERDANQLSVRLELQADCLSGVWTRHAAARLGALDRGDIEEALNAAARIGDDALQKRSQGYVVPDSFTHGSSEQRVRWFETGLASGDVQSCDTFAARNL